MKVRCGILINNQAKALESIQLRACNYILGCSLTTCDEPVRADISLKILRNRRDFRKQNWYCKVMCINDERLPFKLYRRGSLLCIYFNALELFSLA